LPFKVTSAAQMAKHIRDYQHIVIDTEGNPSDEDFRELAEGCDLMVIPAEPETVATDGLIHTLEKLQALKNDRYKVLLTKVPPIRAPKASSSARCWPGRASRSSRQRFPG
jgi:chromosome partitioning protein